ncbi:DUF3800 domain-containing protein [Pedobacter miscanthi]|uniref:DUF3800 domain-containing protein n=1 Tax=Pedobacter miscanthi TaxID=2259170 RepID=UPI00292E581B|nr:DUF3800 domain-containing protein [Pedobacter miscanthi]
MGCIYVDDSVHDQGGFIICTCVYSEENLDDEIKSIIADHDLDPQVFECKSRTNYSKEPEKAKVRSALKALLQEKCKIGIAIIPRDRREFVGMEVLTAMKQFIEHNNINEDLDVYLDEGMFMTSGDFDKAMNDIKLASVKVHQEQDSKVSRGIQLADLASHMIATQLKGAMGLVTKTVKAGDNSGYDPDLDLELTLEMFAALRNNLFSKTQDAISVESLENAILDVYPYGLYISENCGEELSDYSMKTFGKVYLGCMH